MATAEVRVSGLPVRKESIRERLPGAVIEHNEVVVRSALGRSLPLNDHLVGLWNVLRQHRRFLKSLQQEGGKLTCRCMIPKSGAILKPNGAEMLHLLEMELVLEIG
ncbi:MAG TPA: hypothetical protein VF064_01575 [Pyrinomonadaceae bacterium]